MQRKTILNAVNITNTLSIHPGNYLSHAQAVRVLKVLVPTMTYKPHTIMHVCIYM